MADRTMSPKEGRLFREVFYMQARAAQDGVDAPFLVDGPLRGKLAARMAEAGWLADHGAIGQPIPLGHAYKVTQAGINAHNAALNTSEG